MPIAVDMDHRSATPMPFFDHQGQRGGSSYTDGVVAGINTNHAEWLVPAQTIVITVEDSLVADITQKKTRTSR